MPSMPGMSWKPLVALAAGTAAVLVMLMLLVKSLPSKFRLVFLEFCGKKLESEELEALGRH